MTTLAAFGAEVSGSQSSASPLKRAPPFGRFPEVSDARAGGVSPGAFIFADSALSDLQRVKA